MNLWSWAKLSVRRDGVLRTLADLPTIARHQRLVRRHLRADSGRAFDERFETDTVEPVTLFELESVHLHAAHPDGYGMYDAAPPETVAEALAAVDVDHASTTFIDLGAGKGRTLLLGAAYPYRRIVGVEIAPELCAIARENAARYARRAEVRSPIEIVCANVDDYDFPKGNIVAYLFNPFGVKLLSRTVGRILKADDVAGRQITIVYVNPVQGFLLTDLAGFDVVASSEGTVPWAVMARCNAAR